MKNLFILFFAFLLFSQVFAEKLDPTQPPDFNSVTPGSHTESIFELNAIFISSGKNVAVINGQAVKVGDEILDAKVVSIKPNVVQLEGSSGKITLILLDKS